MDDLERDPKKDGYVQSYTPITKIASKPIVDQVFDAAISKTGFCAGGPAKREGRSSCDAAGISLWRRFCGMSSSAWAGVATRWSYTPGVKITFWPRGDQDITHAPVDIEPPVVMYIFPEFFAADEIRYSVWVQENYLQTDEGKAPANMLMLAKLALPDPFAEADPD